MNTIDPELLKAFDLVAEYDRTRPKVIKEYRLYYNEDGSIIGLWETDHPDGNYIVLEDPDEFNRSSTSRLHVANGKLQTIDPTILHRTQLVKSTAGVAVVRGHAALVLYPDEEYSDREFYDRKTNN